MSTLLAFAIAFVLVGSVRFAYALGVQAGKRQMLARFRAELDEHLLTITRGQARLAELATSYDALQAEIAAMQAAAQETHERTRAH